MNIVNFRQDPMQDAPTSRLYFPVETQNVIHTGSDDEYYESSAYKAVVRTDTNELLAVHTNAYKLIKNEDLFPKFDDAIANSSIDTTGMTIKDELSHSGGRAVRTYRFPAHRIEVTSGDHMDLQIMLKNSYDGSWSFGYMMGAFRLLCSNGMVAGDAALQVRMKHTRNMSIDPYVQNLDTSVRIYMDNAAVWKDWVKKPVSVNDVHELLETTNLSENVQNAIENQYHREAAKLGHTMWALYNAMTNWSTHASVRRSSQPNAASVRIDREDKVRTIMTSKPFLALAA